VSLHQTTWDRILGSMCALPQGEISSCGKRSNTRQLCFQQVHQYRKTLARTSKHTTSIDEQPQKISIHRANPKDKRKRTRTTSVLQLVEVRVVHPCLRRSLTQPKVVCWCGGRWSCCGGGSEAIGRMWTRVVRRRFAVGSSRGSITADDVAVARQRLSGPMLLDHRFRLLLGRYGSLTACMCTGELVCTSVFTLALGFVSASLALALTRACVGGFASLLVALGLELALALRRLGASDIHFLHCVHPHYEGNNTRNTQPPTGESSEHHTHEDTRTMHQLRTTSTRPLHTEIFRQNKHSDHARLRREWDDNAVLGMCL
jgi:hypothetical protein